VILIITYSGAFGGAERVLIDVAPAFGGDPVLACPEGPLAQVAREHGLTVLSLPARSLKARGGAGPAGLAAARLAAHAREIRQLVASLDPELVVAWGMRSGIAALAGPGLGCPIVFQHNDLLPSHAIRAVVRRAASRASLVLAPSRTVAEDLDPSGGLGDRLMVVPPGVDVERFDSRRASDPSEVLVLGAIVGWKRPDLALEACALARRQVPGLRLRLVGAPLTEDGGALVAELERRASAPDLAGAVELPGAVAHPVEELVRASCLLHCAEREPFGMAVLEALAAGRPVVVPASGGPAEIVDDSCGLLYRPGDPASAADAIVKVLGDPALADRLGAAGRERAKREFGLDRARRGYSRAVAPMLGGRARHRDAHTERAQDLAQARGPAASAECALLTVTHNSAGHLRALLTSTRRHLPRVPIVVVDCASDDGTVALARSFERTRTIALPDNVGFGRACNRGIAEISEPVTILVNPDVELLDDSLLGLVQEALLEDRDERLLAPLVLSPDGSRQDSVHPVPTSAADLVRSLVPPAAVPGRLGVALAPWRSRAPRRVGWAVGCALVARTETLRRMGPFDERIFLYGEDLDLGLRAAANGVETWFWPRARVIHHGAHSSAAAFGGEPFVLLAAARQGVVARHLGRWRAWVDGAAQALTFSSRLVLKRALGRPAAREREQLRALRDSRRSSAGC
jgi:N-acetylglucosaminyl-diphospho-decaprenol L-rhamnosyltransferase